MCPICLTTVAALAAGAGTTTGIAAWLLGKRVAWRRATALNRHPQDG